MFDLNTQFQQIHSLTAQLQEALSEPQTIQPKKQIDEKYIVDLLDRSDKAVKQAVVAIYKRQTSDEQYCKATNHHNKVGFSAYDAPFGSDLAKKVLDGFSLTPKQIVACRKLVKKYRKQLLQIALEK